VVKLLPLSTIFFLIPSYYNLILSSFALKSAIVKVTCSHGDFLFDGLLRFFVLSDPLSGLGERGARAKESE
jgi:hypothetical protein